jgi:transcriptional regulator with GAF, ATPase, and Fis domain
MPSMEIDQRMTVPQEYLPIEEGIRPESKTVQVDDEKKLVYASTAMEEVVSLADRLADEEVPVVLLGETGVGKDLVAKILHTRSKRVKHPFKAVNCAALSPFLLESELFGHVKGAFTGAHARHDGLLKTVGEGTLFLDEIAEMEPCLQSKLLRVLQGAGFRPIGDSNGEQKFAGRIITATNRNLAKEIKNGSFRLDLFFRIAQFQLEIPPLRERPEDIDPLIDFFLRGLKGEVSITQQARKKLKEHSFPGNVRELEAVLRKAYILATLKGQENPVIGDTHIEFYDLSCLGNSHSSREEELSLEALNTRLRILEDLLKEREAKK